MNTTRYTVRLGVCAGRHILSYEFDADGPSDEKRMVRAMCFYDTVLFNEGLQREKILRGGFQVDPSRQSGIAHKGMVEAYKNIADQFGQVDHMQIISVDRKINVLKTSSPIVGILKELPDSIDYVALGCSDVLENLRK